MFFRSRSKASDNFSETSNEDLRIAPFSRLRLSPCLLAVVLRPQQCARLSVNGTCLRNYL